MNARSGSSSVMIWRLFGRWTWIATLVANLCVVGMVGFASVQGYDRAVGHARFLTENYSHSLEEVLTGFVRNVDSALLTVVETVERQRGTLDVSARTELLERQLSHVPGVLGLRILDGEGYVKHVVGDVRAKDVNLGDRDYFLKQRDDPQAGLVISDPVFSRISQQWVIVIGRRINNPDGSFAGSVHAAISTRQLIQILGKIDLGPHGNSGLWTRKTLVARYSRDDAQGARTGATTPSPQLRELLAAGADNQHYRAHSGIDGMERQYFFQRVGDLDLYTVVGLADVDFLNDWRNDTFRLGLIALVFALVTLLFARGAFRTWKHHEQMEEALRESRERLDVSVDAADLAMTDWDVRADSLIFGSGWKKLLGYDLKDLQPKPSTLLQLVHQQDIPKARAALLQHLKGEKPMFEAEVRFQHKDGHWTWVLARGRAVEWLANGRVARVSGIAIDITKRKDAERQIERLSQWNELLLNSAGEGIYGVDLDGRCTFVNPAALTMLGYARDEVVGQDQHALFHRHQTDAPTVAEADCPVFATLRDGIRRETEDHFMRKGGDIFPVQLTVTPIHEHGRLVGVEVVFQDIARRKSLEAELVRLANTDPLTGIANRRRLLECMVSELARVKRYRESTYLLMLDLDEFKRINDTWGHSVGDKALKHFADICRLRIRQADFFGRLGGEEFAIILARTDRSGAEQFAEALRRSVAESPLHVDAGEVAITVSIGVARFRASDESTDALMVRADVALYRAKAAGRNTVVIESGTAEVDPALARKA